MSARLSRRAALAALGAGLGRAAFAGAPELSLWPVPRPAGLGEVAAPAGPRDVVADVNLPGFTTYAVADARTGEILDARHPETPMPTASVAKFLTAQYALETFGRDHRFVTRIGATAPIAGGRIDGDLVLIGGGDPMLDSDDLAAMVKELTAAGLREVTGRLLVHRGDLPLVPRIDPGQPSHLHYNPAVAGLNLNFNRVYFEWKKNGSGYDVRMDARGAGVQPLIPMTEMRVVDRSGPVFGYEAQGAREVWTVARGALGKGGARWLPVRHPGLYSGHALRGLLAEAEIAAPAPELIEQAPEIQVLAENASLPLERITRSMLYFSTNLIAEVIGLGASVRRGAEPQGLAQSAAEMNAWAAARFDAAGMELADHSGLGDRSRANAAALVAALVGIGPESIVGRQMRRHPMPKEGAGIEVRAKTGTLNFVSGLAGFARAGGRDLAFAILSADLATRAAVPAAERERPRGAKGWANRARYQDGQLLIEWARRFGA